jgi:hypothetical protein
MLQTAKKMARARRNRFVAMKAPVERPRELWADLAYKRTTLCAATWDATNAIPHKRLTRIRFILDPYALPHVLSVIVITTGFLFRAVI